MHEGDEFAQGLALWPLLAEEAGLATDGWSPRQISRRSDSKGSRIVIGLRHPDLHPLVLKARFQPVQPTDFVEEIDHQIAASSRVADLSAVSVPLIRAHDVATQSVLMDEFTGITLFTALDETNCDRAELLRRAGAGLAAFHKAGFAEHRVFQPRFTFGYLRKVMATVEAGQRKLAQADRFMVLAERFCATEAAFEGWQTVSCLGHGDLHMRNLLIDVEKPEAGIALIDGRPGGPSPVAHDLARILVDYAAMIPKPDGSIAGPLPGVDLGPFFEGYDLVGPNDLGLHCMCRMRILADWMMIPAAAKDRTPSHKRRFAGLRKLGTLAFPNPASAGRTRKKRP